MTDDPTYTQKPRRRAYSYLRFSTPEQSKGDSLGRQTRMAVEYARHHHLDLDAELTFQDQGVSGFRGKNANEGQLAAFREAVQVGLVPQGSVLLVEQLDRLSRSAPRKAMRLLEDIVEAGVSVVTLNDGREYTPQGLDRDPTDLLVSLMTFIRAHEESETKSRRLAQAWEKKRQDVAVKPLTSKCPAWLRLDREQGAFVLIPERAALVRRMFEMTLAGSGQHDIAKTFTAEGVPTWGSATFWQRSYVARVLSNPAAIGALTPHVMDHSGSKKTRRPLEPVTGYYPAAVSEELFAEVQALQPAASGTVNRRRLANVLGSLAACPACGRTMTRVQKGKKGLPAFVCVGAKGGAGCPYKSVRYSQIESRLLRVLPGVLRDREGLDVVEWHGREVFDAEEAVYQLQGQVENLLDLLSQQASPALLARLATREKELEDARQELRALEERRDLHAGPLLQSRINRAIAALQAPELDRAEVNVALRALFKRAVINWPEGRVDLDWTAGGTCHVHYAWVGGAYVPPPADDVPPAA